MKIKFTILLTALFLGTTVPLVFVGASPTGVDTRDTPTYNDISEKKKKRFQDCLKAAKKRNKEEKAECKREYKKCANKNTGPKCRRAKASCSKKIKKNYKKEKKICAKKLF